MKVWKKTIIALPLILILVLSATAIPVQDDGASGDIQNEGTSLVICLSGSPSERGLEYGTTAREGIRQNLELFWENVDESEVSKASLITKAAEREYSLPAEMKEELVSIATGAQVDYYELLAMNLFGSSFREPGGCTQFIAAGSGTVDGDAIASKNRDESGVNILIIIEPTEDSYGFIAVTEAGYWGVSFGLNEMSVCDGNNWMPIPDYAFYEGGMTELTINRLVLEKCASVDEAIEFVDDAPKYGGSTIMVADCIEGAFIETVPSDGGTYWLNSSIPDAVAVKVVDGVACHTNHYLYEPFYSMVIEDGFGSMWTPSIARYDNGIRLIEEAGNVVSTEQIIEFCRDLEDFGNSHPNWIKDEHPEIPWECWEDGWPGFSICNARTVSSGVFELNGDFPDMLSKMWTAIYNPCWCPYVPLHNALIKDPEAANERLIDYRDGTAWLTSMKLRATNENDWGCMVPVFEEWEQNVREDLTDVESLAIELISEGKYDEAAQLLIDTDCGNAMAAFELMLDLGSWINGNYAENDEGSGLRSGEVGDKMA